MADFSWTGFDALSRKLRRLSDPDASDLMITWRKIIEEDNARGVMAGTDKDGNPMIPVTYRNGAAAPLPKRKALPEIGAHKQAGPLSEGLHGNLTSAEYRKLTGPPLAPRGLNSRVITNLQTEHGRDPGDRFRWYAVGAWFDVVSTKGVQFLQYHFTGAGRLPKRDLRGVRPEGKRLAREALRSWIRTLTG